MARESERERERYIYIYTCILIYVYMHIYIYVYIYIYIQRAVYGDVMCRMQGLGFTTPSGPFEGSVRGCLKKSRSMQGCVCSLEVSKDCLVWGSLITAKLGAKGSTRTPL